METCSFWHRFPWKIRTAGLNLFSVESGLQICNQIEFRETCNKLYAHFECQTVSTISFAAFCKIQPTKKFYFAICLDIRQKSNNFVGEFWASKKGLCDTH